MINDDIFAQVPESPAVQTANPVKENQEQRQQAALAPVPETPKEEPVQAPAEGAKEVRETKRKRRTNEEIEADRKAEREKIEAEILAQLRAEGRLRDNGDDTRTLAEEDAERKADTANAETIKALPIDEILRHVQAAIKVPKSRMAVGSGNDVYPYRTAADILEKTKPVCEKYGCKISISNRVEYHSDVFCYIISEATISKDNGERITASAMAREEHTHTVQTGYQPFAQGTGSCISYANKYALCNLLAIDDSEDPDAARDIEKRASSQQASAASPGAPVLKQEVSVPAPKPERKKAVKAETKPEEATAEQKPEAEPAEATEVKNAGTAEGTKSAEPAKVPEAHEAKAEEKPAEPAKVEAPAAEAPVQATAPAVPEAPKSDAKPEPAVSGNGLPVVKVGDGNFGRIVNYIATHPFVDANSLRMPFANKGVISDEVWHEALKKAGHSSIRS